MTHILVNSILLYIYSEYHPMGVCQNGHIFFFEEMVNPFREKRQPFL